MLRSFRLREAILSILKLNLSLFLKYEYFKLDKPLLFRS
jgi:hypothetical protein